jgi:hypothetical protein
VVSEAHIRSCLELVAAAHTAGADDWEEGGATVCRVTGGFNNALYRVDVGGQPYAVKLCVADGRRRAAREYGVLRLLHSVGLDIAPQPLWLDESHTILPFPTVVYRWLPGNAITRLLTQQQLAGLLQSYQDMHALRWSDYAHVDLPDAWFHWFDFEPYLDELDGFLAEYGSWLAISVPQGQDLRDRLARLLDRFATAVAVTAANPGREDVPLSICRVDSNLANGVWGEDSRLRWVDWEYSGWGDPALDLAELRWHASYAELSEAQRLWLRNNYRRPDNDPSFEERLVVWDHLLAARWPFLVLRTLWSVYNGPDRVRLTQPDLGPAELHARLVCFIERAERSSGVESEGL